MEPFGWGPLTAVCEGYFFIRGICVRRGVYWRGRDDSGLRSPFGGGIEDVGGA